jgi:hypothetical protein
MAEPATTNPFENDELARRKQSQAREIGQGIDRGLKELCLLAEYYYEQGFVAKSQEIFRAIMTIRQSQQSESGRHRH